MDRTQWPWHSAPGDETDYDGAVWHAIRRQSGGQLPVQSYAVWVARQRASRDIWEWLEPEPLTEAEHEQLLAALAAVWRDPRFDPGRNGPVPLRWANGRLTGGAA